jgi:arginine decarboxylase
VDQVFPAAPLSRHGDRTTVQATVVDITCDSDGSVAAFAHPDENLKELPLHEPREDELYFLGFFMTGAYQDALSNEHNLFGRCHEVVVRDPDEDLELPRSERVEIGDVVLEVKMGDTNEDVLARMDFGVEDLLMQIRDRHLEVESTLGKPWALGLLQSYPYLTR